MHVLAIYRVNEQLGELMADAAEARQAKASKPRASRIAALASRITGRTAAPSPAAGPTKALAGS